MSTNQLPETGFLRLKQIIGDKESSPPIPALIPISKSAWWAGIRSEKYPKSCRLSANTTVWRVEDIKELIEKISNQEH